MRLIFTVLFSLIFTILFAEQNTTIRFSPIPMMPKKQCFQEFTPFVDYLSKQIGQKISIEYRSFYDEVINDFIDDKIDMAFLGPLSYVLLKEQYPEIVPVVMFLNSNGKNTYTCSLVQFGNDSDISSDATISLTQPYSTCGYLMTEVLLNKYNKSITDFMYFYIGNHRDCAMSVIKGQTKYAGLKTSIAKQFTHLGINIIASTEAIPSFILVANPKTLTQSTIDKIKRHLIKLDPKNAFHKEIMRSWNIIIKNGSELVDEKAYNIIMQKYKSVTIPGLSI